MKEMDDVIKHALDAKLLPTNRLQGVIARLKALRQKVEELERDRDRLDVLADLVSTEPLLLHNGEPGMGYRGLGLKNLDRTLRKALDDMTPQPKIRRTAHG